MRIAILLSALLFLGCAAEAPVVQPAVSEQTANGRVGSHGMIVAGSPESAILSHIPMFQMPHDVQLVVAGKFEGGDMPGSFGEQLFTFLPDRLSLDALRTGVLRELRGTLFFGNFEAGGRPLPGQFRFVVDRVVHQHVLDAQAVESRTYFLVGSRAQTFAIHRIGGAPGFDEIVRVRVDEDGPSDAELHAGVEARVTGSAGRLGLATEPVAMENETTFAVERVLELSCLAGPGFASPCL